MQLTPSPGRLRLAARLHPHGVLGLATGPVRIGQLEPALVFRPRLEIQDAAGKSVGDRVVEILASPVDVLPADSHQRQGRRQADSPTARNSTATVAFRFASPRISHSKPRFKSVGCSATNSSRQRPVLDVGPHGSQDETQETRGGHGRRSTRGLRGSLLDCRRAYTARRAGETSLSSRGAGGERRLRNRSGRGVNEPVRGAATIGAPPWP